MMPMVVVVVKICAFIAGGAVCMAARLACHI